jgi:hypothetical protein
MSWVREPGSYLKSQGHDRQPVLIDRCQPLEVGVGNSGPPHATRLWRLLRHPIDIPVRRARHLGIPTTDADVAPHEVFALGVRHAMSTCHPSSSQGLMVKLAESYPHCIDGAIEFPLGSQHRATSAYEAGRADVWRRRPPPAVTDPNSARGAPAAVGDGQSVLLAQQLARLQLLVPAVLSRFDVQSKESAAALIDRAAGACIDLRDKIAPDLPGGGKDAEEEAPILVSALGLVRPRRFRFFLGPRSSAEASPTAPTSSSSKTSTDKTSSRSISEIVWRSAVTLQHAAPEGGERCVTRSPSRRRPPHEDARRLTAAVFRRGQRALRGPTRRGQSRPDTWQRDD